MENLKEKQIEEMANEVCTDCRMSEHCHDILREACTYRKAAKILYHKGYRKQSVGEWVDKYHGKYANQLFKCSVCGATAHSDDRGHWFLTPYCPNCGARMGGGDRSDGEIQEPGHTGDD